MNKKIVIISFVVLVLLIGGGVAYATNTPTARAERQLNIGNICLQQGKYQDAILAFQKSLENKPNNISAKLGLGKAYVADENYGNAEKAVKEVVEIDKNNIQAREALFEIYLKENNLDSANTILQEIVKIDPNNQDAPKLKSDYNKSLQAKREQEGSTSQPNQTKDYFITYTNSKYGYALSIPIDWQGHYTINENSTVECTGKDSYTEFLLKTNNNGTPRIFLISAMEENHSAEWGPEYKPKLLGSRNGMNFYWVLEPYEMTFDPAKEGDGDRLKTMKNYHIEYSFRFVK